MKLRETVIAKNVLEFTDIKFELIQIKIIIYDV